MQPFCAVTSVPHRRHPTRTAAYAAHLHESIPELHAMHFAMIAPIWFGLITCTESLLIRWYVSPFQH